MEREDVHREKRRDERWESLKRRVQLLARLEGSIVLLDEGVHVVAIERVREPERLVRAMRETGVASAATLAAFTVLGRPAQRVDAALLATAQRDLRALAVAPARALAKEHRKALARFGERVGDEAWLAAKQRRLAELAEIVRAVTKREKDDWFASVLEIVRAIHGDASSMRLDEARAQLTALGAERKRHAAERIEAVVAALERGAIDVEPEIAALAERLERARTMPGRARRTRVLVVLREAARWPEAFAEGPKKSARLPDAIRALAERTASFEDALRDAGRALVRAMPAGRDPDARARILELLAFYGSIFRVGRDGVPALGEKDVERLLEARRDARELERANVTFAQAAALLEMKMERAPRGRLAKLVGEGLELDLVKRAVLSGHGEPLSRSANVRAARAYATWATKLVPHYKSLGVTIPLGPELFANLPRHEDLAVLGLCLMEHGKQEIADPVAVLDATLGLFQKMPTRAGGIVARLRGTDPGAGARAFPDVAAWLGDDALLDRFAHVTRLAGLPVVLTKQLREDFDHAAKASRERAHLEALPSRHARQEARLSVLRRTDRTRGASRDNAARTRRRIAERVERYLPIAYRRELDAAFREILRDAWGIDVPVLTEPWRDAVRFWLVVDDNRDLLGQLLRAAAANPGRDVKLGFEKNRAWIARAREKFAVDAWLAPRRDEIALEGERYIVALEDDPLEVLRMGIPFATCLALDEGCNAASTVSNALEANKRVLYVRTRDGKIVARKLLAVSKDFRLLGYNLYVAVHGALETAIRGAVEQACRTLMRECALEPTITGEPEPILGGFWYDDGACAFESDADVATYVSALGLRPEPKWYEAIAVEARGHAAIERGDADAAVRHVTRWDRGPANVALGAFVVARLGEREAERRARDNTALVPALLRAAAKDEDGIVHALQVAARTNEWAAAQSLGPLLGRFPRSSRIARGLAELAVRAARVRPRTGDHGLVHLTFGELDAKLDGIEEAFDVLDAIAPAWEHLLSVAPGCRACRAGAEERCARAVLAAFERKPDEAAIASCLMSRHRSAASQRAALLVAQRHVLGSDRAGARALSRLATLRPELARSPELFVANVVQRGIMRVEAIDVDRAPYEALGPRLFELQGLDAALARFEDVPLATWKPGAWELAWLRRHAKKPLRERLYDAACATRWSVTRAYELLALLGDVEMLERFDRRPDEIPKERPSQKAETIKTLTDAMEIARSLARQSLAAEEGRVCAIGAATIVDRHLVERAVAVLRGPPPSRARDGIDDRALAIEILAQSGMPLDWNDILRTLDADALRRILPHQPRHTGSISPETIATAWQRAPAELASALARSDTDEWSSRVMAAEHVANVDGLLEAWAFALLEKGSSNATDLESDDQLRAVVRAVVLRADRVSAQQAITFYESLPDELAASWFVRAVRRAARDRAAALREAGTKMRGAGARAARKAWLEATRSQKSRGRVSSTRAQTRAIETG
ncbi:MAG TPA: hypothetical protein VIF62_28655 [Labilithrix sp.]